MTSPNVISLFSDSSEDLLTDLLSEDKSTYLHRSLADLCLTNNIDHLKALVETYAREIFAHRPHVHIYSSSLYSYGRFKTKKRLPYLYKEIQDKQLLIFFLSEWVVAMVHNPDCILSQSKPYLQFILSTHTDTHNELLFLKKYDLLRFLGKQYNDNNVGFNIQNIEITPQCDMSFLLISALRALSLLDTLSLENATQVVNTALTPQIILKTVQEFQIFAYRQTHILQKTPHFSLLAQKQDSKYKLNRHSSAPCVIQEMNSLDYLDSMSQSKSDLSGTSRDDSVSLRDIDLPSSPMSCDIDRTNLHSTQSRTYNSLRRKAPVRRWKKKQEVDYLETPMKLLNPSGDKNTTTKRNNLNAIWIQDQAEIPETQSEDHRYDISKVQSFDMIEPTAEIPQEILTLPNEDYIQIIQKDSQVDNIHQIWEIAPDKCESPVQLVSKYSFEDEVPVLEKRMKKEMTFSMSSIQCGYITDLTDTSTITESSLKTVSFILTQHSLYLKPVVPIDMVYSITQETPTSTLNQTSYTTRHKNSVFSELSISSFEEPIEPAPVFTNESESPNTFDYSNSLLVSENNSPKASLRLEILKYPYISDKLPAALYSDSEGKPEGWDSPRLTDPSKVLISPFSLESSLGGSLNSFNKLDGCQEDSTVRSPVSEGTEELIKNTDILHIRISEIREKLNSIQMSDSSPKEPLFTFMDGGSPQETSMALEMDEGFGNLSIPVAYIKSYHIPEHIEKYENDETKTVTHESFKESIIGPVYKEILLLDAPVNAPNTEAGSPQGRNVTEWKVMYEEGKSCKCETCVLL